MSRKTIILLSIGGGLVGALALLALVYVAPEARAGSLAQNGAPSVVSYQGYLTDESGEPISGTVTLRFGLYAASSGGSALWEETKSNVQVGNGFFATLLGSVTPLSAADFDDTTRYLQ